MTSSSVTIHESVKEYYTGRIEAQSSCCGNSSDCACGSYDDTVLENIPEYISNMSFGCGDPVTIASLKTGETVLDLGSGAGMDCFLAAHQVGESGRVIGVDMTPAMLKKANENKERLGLNHVEFREGNIENLPVEANSVDIIMSNCVINLSPQKADVFAEAYRVLKPGGRLAISDIVTDGHFSQEHRADMEAWSACVSGAIPVVEYTGLMQAAGFINIQVVDKENADVLTMTQSEMPRIYSARITAYKPA
jgi:SAM-dependent methyltransferase